METITTHSFQEETQPDARFTKVIDGKEIIVRVPKKNLKEIKILFNAG